MKVISALPELVSQLERLDWRVARTAHSRVEELLKPFGVHPHLIVKEVQKWRENDLEDRASRSHETSTHYKWFVAGDFAGEFTIWLHQYKPLKLRREGYAVVPHTHRYWFSSVVLAGGFVNRFYEWTGVPPLRSISQTHLESGETYTVSPEHIHGLEDISEGTMTLVVQGSPVRHYSDVYSNRGAVISRYPDFIGQLDVLEDQLACLE